jgi:hypothetical protein
VATTYRVVAVPAVRILSAWFLTLTAPPAHARTANADSAHLITGSISKFWRAIDRAAGQDTAALIAALREDYLANASPGLLDWIVNRLINQDAAGQMFQGKGWTRQRAMSAMGAAAGGWIEGHRRRNQSPSVV